MFYLIQFKNAVYLSCVKFSWFLSEIPPEDISSLEYAEQTRWTVQGNIVNIICIFLFITLDRSEAEDRPLEGGREKLNAFRLSALSHDPSVVWGCHASLTPWRVVVMKGVRGQAVWLWQHRHSSFLAWPGPLPCTFTIHRAPARWRCSRLL